MNEYYFQGGQPQNSKNGIAALVCAICGFASSVILALASILLIYIDKFGFVVYFCWVPVVSLVLSAIGTAKAHGNKLSKTFGIIGIVLSSIMLVIVLFCIFVLILFIQACSNIVIKF